MIEVFANYRVQVGQAIEELIRDCSGHLERVGSWGKDLNERLTDFALRGKLIRGSLVCVGAEIFGANPGADIYRTAAGIELVQSFLLIHDDIMDEDATRRGKPTIFEQYRRLGSRDSYANPDRFGESMGICAGDVAMMICVEGILSTGFPDVTKTALVRVLAREIADVGVAQMSDVANGHATGSVDQEQVLSVYRYKTGRYTFSLPLVLGAMIASASEDDIENLSRWGELQGIIFQIRDDQLGLVGDERDTGKPLGSDIETNKQTLHRLRLGQAAKGTRWEHVCGYFGRAVNADEIREVQSAMADLGVIASIDGDIERLDQESRDALEGVKGLNRDSAATLARIAGYNRTRIS